MSSSNGASSAPTPAQEALAKAQAIAAKLLRDGAGTPGTSGAGANSSGTAKRSRWGMAPTDSSASAPSSSSNKRSNSNVEKVTQRLWISTTEERPAAHFREYLNRHLPALRAQIDKVDAGDDDNNECTVELQGRGSGGKPPLPGMPQQPLHVWLEGTSPQISQAEPLVETLLQEAETAPIEEEAIRLDKEAEENKKYQLATVASKDGNSAYRPASVAILIGQAYNPEAVAAAQQNGQPWVEVSMQVPSGLVGYIIGKGGENISRLSAQTGARIQIQRVMDLQPGQTTRTIDISAPTDDAAQHCQNFIENIVAEKTRQMGGATGGGTTTSSAGGASGPKEMQRVEEAIAAGHEHLCVKIPDDDVGLIIGKGGSTIKSLQERSGAGIQVLSNPDADGLRQVHVTHPDLAGARQAEAMIQDILQSKANRKETRETTVHKKTIQVMIPDSDVGLCIGRQGSTIKHMQQTTNTNIQIPPQCNPGEMHRVATVTGSEEGCEKVKQMIQRIITQQSSLAVTNGQQPAAHQYYQQPSEGQQGYSAEWAAYHAAQQAAAAQQQQHQPVSSAAAPAVAYQNNHQAHSHPAQQQTAAPSNGQQQPGSDAYYEQFFRYAYYYGEPAARQYYGAWAPPVGTPNPYGTNPNGVQPAPATAPTPTPAPAAASAPPPAPRADHSRETSRRAVSNLPAWMTKK